MDTEIELVFRRKDIEEIFYQNKQGNYFLSPLVKDHAIPMIILFLLLTASSLYAYFVDEFTSLILLFGILFITFFLLYLKRLILMIRWKRAVKSHLDREEKYKTHKILITDKAFSIVQDDKETIENWSNFKSATITDDHIYLLADQNYFIPAKSMSALDYNALRLHISEKIKN